MKRRVKVAIALAPAAVALVVGAVGTAVAVVAAAVTERRARHVEAHR